MEYNRNSFMHTATILTKVAFPFKCLSQIFPKFISMKYKLMIAVPNNNMSRKILKGNRYRIAIGVYKIREYP